VEQFVVPQFIDVEDKIFGPITTRQFVIILVGALLLFIAFKLADTALFIFFLATIGSFTLILAFVKINGQAFHFFLLNIFQTLRRPSLRIWQKKFDNVELKDYIDSGKVSIPETVKEIPHMSYNRIRDLSLVVNTGGYYNPEQ
jgi:hypothetical protein